MRSAVILYNQRTGGVGGAENSAACAAEVLEAYGPVDILHCNPDLGADVRLLQDRFGIELRNTRLKSVADPVADWQCVLNPIKRLGLLKRAHRAMSDGYDVCVVMTHEFPPFAFGKMNILHVMFPFDTADEYWGHSTLRTDTLRRRVVASLKKRYHRLEWQLRLKSYDLHTANSDFTSRWTEERWSLGARCTTWYPPVTPVQPVSESERKASLLAVGRICPEKQPREMVSWFRQLSSEQPDAAMVIAGMLREGQRAHHDSLLADAAGLQLRIQPNISLNELHRLYASSSIFWHTMGYGVPQDQPQNCEHFGMTTVEAMSAGCVPVVFARGGQVEIVQDGVNGFTWNDPQELIAHTRRLLSDEPLRRKMSAAAMRRAELFTKRAFQDRLLRAVKSQIPGAVSASASRDGSALGSLQPQPCK